MGWRPHEIYTATFPEFLFSFRGWQMSKGIDPDKKKVSGFGQDDLKALMEKFPDKVAEDE